jgi:hypothetical protein
VRSSFSTDEIAAREPAPAENNNTNIIRNHKINFTPKINRSYCCEAKIVPVFVNLIIFFQTEGESPPKVNGGKGANGGIRKR